VEALLGRHHRGDLPAGLERLDRLGHLRPVAGLEVAGWHGPEVSSELPGDRVVRAGLHQRGEALLVVGLQSARLPPELLGLGGAGLAPGGVLGVGGEEEVLHLDRLRTLVVGLVAVVPGLHLLVGRLGRGLLQLVLELLLGQGLLESLEHLGVVL
jgi:hypothetical protein